MKNPVNGLFRALAAVTLSAASLQASNDTWVGNTDATWSNAANWTFSSGSAVNPSGDYLIFGVAGTSGATLNNDLSAYNFAGITFNSGAAAFTFTGNAITLAGGITNNATGTETDNLNMTLAASQIINANAGAVTLGGVIDDAGSGYGLTFAGGKSSTLTGANTYSGLTLLSSSATFTFSGVGSVANSVFNHGVQGSGVATYMAVSPTAAGTVTRAKAYVYNGVALGGNNFHNFTVNGTSAGNTVEQLGDLTLNSGELEGTIAANSAANVQVVFNSVTRKPGTTFYFGRSTSGIGGNPIANQTANAANIVFNTGPAMSGGVGAAGSPNIGIVPWADFGSGTRVTYDSTYGLRALGSGETVALTASGFVGSDGTTNVNTAGVTLTGSSAINSIAGGGTVGLGGFTLTVASGVVIAGTSTTIGSTVNDGFLALGSEGHFFSENARPLTINSSISGTGGLTINLDDLNGTTASCTLAGTNTYSGVTTVEGNNAAMALNINNALALQNSTLDYNNYGAKVAFGGSQTYYVLGGLKGAQSLAITVPVTLGGDGDSTIYSGVLSGAGSLIKTGAGSFTLTGANTYSGGTTVSNGVLNINNGGGSSANSALGTGALTISGGTIDNTSGSAITLAPNNAQNWNGNFTFAGSSSLNLGTGLVALGGNEQVTVNANTLTVGGAISGTGFGLTKSGAGKLALTAANTYTGNTTINGGTFALSGSGSIPSSIHITVASGATLDVSGASSTFTLGGSQILYGAGTNNGSISTSSGSQIYADGGGSYATNTFDNNLTFVSGAAVNFQLSTSASGPNDLMIVGGSLTANGNTINISAPSASVNLGTGDYTLFTVSGGITGSFAATPNWVVRPLNYGNYSVVTSGSTVKLHYQSAVLPSATGFATPATVNRSQGTILTVSVVPGTYPIASVTVNASPIGGASAISLIQSNLSNIYTNTVVVGASTAAGAVSLTATVADTQANTATASIALNVLPGAETWNGASVTDNNWSDTANWVGGLPPLGGDAVTFAGTSRLGPVMDNSYTLSSLAFASGAGAFVVTNAPGTLLSLDGAGITNNSVNPQTLNLPVAISTAQTVNAAAGNIAIGGVVSGTASLALTGNYQLALAGANTYGGGTLVNSGTLVVANNSAFGSGAVTLNGGAVSNAAGVNYTVPNNVSLSGAGSVGVGSGDTFTLSGVVSGGAALTKTGGGSLLLPNANNNSGGVTVNAGTLVIGNNNAAGSGLLSLGSGAIANIAGNSYILAVPVNLFGSASAAVNTGDTITLTGVITNIGSLTVSGAGTLSLSGSNPNTYTGNTILSAGMLDVENNSATPIGTGNLDLAGGTIENNGGNSVTLSNNIIVVTNTTSHLHPTGFNGNGMIFAGNISGPGNIVVDGSGTTFDSFMLTGTNTAFTGTLTVNQNADQRFAFGNAAAGSPNANFILNSAGTDEQKFTFGTGTIAFGSLSGGGTLRNDGGASVATLRIGDLNSNTAFTGLIVGNGTAQFGILKVGTGALAMTNNNTYSGLTEIAGGELLISEFQGASTYYQVDDGATLGVVNYPGSGLYGQTPILTVGTTNGASLLFTNVDYEGNGIFDVTRFTNNGTCTVVITDTNNLVAGNIYPLIEYATYGSTGAGNFVLSAPPGLQGYVTNDLSIPQLELVVTGFSSVNANPAPLTASFLGNSLSLSWPADHLGWYLQVQTNALGTGLGANWVDVPGSSSVTSESISIDPQNGAVFYRMSLNP